MKKLISCLLAVLLVCSLMSMTVFAADTTYRPVGNNNQGINNGVDDFTSPTQPSDGNGQHDITVNFGQTTNNDGSTSDTNDDSTNNTIVHRYAVDVTYGSFLLDLTQLDFSETEEGDDGILDPGATPTYYMVWDVNTHKYVLCEKDGNGYKEVTLYDENEDPIVDTNANDIADVLETAVTLPGEVKITNHSDLSVNTSITISAKEGYNDISWVINTTKENTAAATNQQELIAKATAGQNGADGSPTEGSTYTFTATPTIANGWLGVIGNFSANNVQNAATIGKITVTISK